MKVLFICDSEAEAMYVRDNHETLEEGIRGTLFWPGFPEFTIVAALREPTAKELQDLLQAAERLS